MFGTFMEERADIPVYGITRPMRTWNPIRINFIHMWLLIKDAWRANSFVDKIRVWSKPTGWRPADVAAKIQFLKLMMFIILTSTKPVKTPFLFYGLGCNF